MEEQLLDFFKEVYKYGLELKSSLNSQLEVSIGVTVVLAGAMAYLFLNLPLVTLGPKTILFHIYILFYALLIAGTVFLIITIYHIYKALVEYKYKYTPPLSEVRTYYEELVRYNKGDIGKTKKDFDEEFLLKFYLDADKNMENNFWKAKHNTIAMKCLFRLVIVIVLMIVPFSLIKLSRKEILSVKIINQEMGGVNMVEQNERDSEKKEETPKPPTSGSSKKEEVQRPKPPEARIVTGAKEEKKPEPPKAREFKEGEEGENSKE